MSPSRLPLTPTLALALALILTLAPEPDSEPGPNPEPRPKPWPYPCEAREHLERLSKAYTKRDVERWERVGHQDALPDARDRGRDSTRMAPRDRLGWPKDDL